MKTLHIVRHGKSSWDLLGIADIDRPLIHRGITNSHLMAERLGESFPIPELILSSPATRAIHTALIFARVLEISIEKVQFRNNIYESDLIQILEVIEETPNNINAIIIVGHNPGFTDLVNHFIPENIDNLPTSGIVSLQFDSKTWEIGNKSPVQYNLNFPKKE